MSFRWLLVCFFIQGCTAQKHEMNHLHDERSQHLIDSAQDPIWWYSWNRTPLQISKEKDRLIFLSIGYATCFSCQKMQNQVYKDAEVAKELNENYVSILVDREERPDLDAYFLNMQSQIMGFGAWPINMILTPDLKPVFATTLMDKTRFLQIIRQSSKAWQSERHKIIEGIANYVAQTQIQEQNKEEYIKDETLINDFYARYTHNFDTTYGGRGVQRNFNNKFPVNDEMRLLLRYYLRSKEAQALKMVNKTITTMARSALFDHVDGGVHRYASSRDWNRPNFEKRLTDQAGFIHALIDIYKVKKTDLYQKTIFKTIDFVKEFLKYPLLGFYSSVSGNSENQEGLYYTFSTNELNQVLSAEQFQVFNEFYTWTRPLSAQDRRQGIRRKTSFFKEDLEPLNQLISEYRKKRGQLKRDRKVITADNAFMISALAKVYRLWPKPDLYTLIQNQMTTLLRQNRRSNGELYRSNNAGAVKEPAVLDDYAYLIDALIEIYQTQFDESWLSEALKLQKIQDQIFSVPEIGLYRYNQANEDFLQDQYLFNDQGRASGLAQTYWNLIRLSWYFNEIGFEQKAQALINAYPDRLRQDPIAYSSLLLALDFKISNPKIFTVLASKQECRQLITQNFSDLKPYTLFSCADPNSRLPLHKGKKAINQKTTFYVCNTRSCHAPTPDQGEALKLLSKDL